MKGFLLLCLGILLPWSAFAKRSSPPIHRFLVLSSASEGTVSFVKLDSFGDEHGLSTFNLLRSEDGLVSPRGVAVDAERGRLYVADSGLSKILQYKAFVHGSDLLCDRIPTTVASGVSVRYIAVDHQGSLYFNAEGKNALQYMTVEMMSAGEPPASLYAGAGAKVMAPRGLAHDSISLVWGNDQQDFSVVKAPEKPENSGQVKVLARTKEPVLGVAADGAHVYYTTARSPAARPGFGGAIYAMKKDGGNPIRISTAVRKPTDIATDSQGNVFVADEERGRVVSFSGAVAAPVKGELPLVVRCPSVWGVAYTEMVEDISSQPRTSLITATAHAVSELISPHVEEEA
ncbi:unnamed protein product [Vitrella brassicaformis CCMP3155]|uniref:SMP-30/Gluconolactonase/LRE-like region domain-containing protein n=1 Tax=Vitrella brassicaformis (strain CCMP3155) TaxID=1169540 RepID=A0A0G4GR51_VITBC|nr:unnamed protein product [Vitrella brassicaformis CCMP3155]|eukprot:CEM33007.1 unnamed protein product [Vitrella brassicaformis CCMP3155]